MKFLSFLIRIISIIFIALGILFVRGAVVSIPNQEDRSAEDKLLFLFLGIVFSSVGAWFYNLSKKLVAKNWESIARDDPRPPVLYLRAFKTDRKGQKQGLHGWWRKLAYSYTIQPANMTTQEEQIKIAFDDIGPMLAVAKPDTVLSPAGSARVKYEDNEWQQEVIKLMHKSSLIVIRCDGNTEGFRWEIENVFREKSPSQIVFLLPASQKEYNAFCQLFPSEISARLHGHRIQETISDFGGLLYFTSSLTPVFVPFKNSIFSPLGESFNHISIAIKDALKKTTLRFPLQPQVELAKFSQRLKAALLDFFIIMPFCLFAACTFVVALQINPLDGFLGGGTVVLLCLEFFYPLIFELYSPKGTFGKRKLSLFIADKSQLKPTAQQIFLRNFFRIVLFLPFFFITVPYTLIACYKNLPLLHDFVSRTRVFKNVPKAITC